MTVIAFDTLDLATKLKEAGMSPLLAEVQARETAKILNNLINQQLVTTRDLYESERKVWRVYSYVAKAISLFLMTLVIFVGLQLLFHFIK